VTLGRDFPKETRATAVLPGVNGFIRKWWTFILKILPALPPGSEIVLDNARFHQSPTTPTCAIVIVNCYNWFFWGCDSATICESLGEHLY
jgi:hypothetical protein